jgi:hypothetical protein
MRRQSIQTQVLEGHEEEHSEQIDFICHRYTGHSDGYRTSVEAGVLREALAKALDRIDALEVRLRAVERLATCHDDFADHGGSLNERDFTETSFAALNGKLPRG